MPSAYVPRTEMIHFLDTALDFPTMVGPIWLVIVACGAPYGPPITLANKGILAVKPLKTWCRLQTNLAHRFLGNALVTGEPSI